METASNLITIKRGRGKKKKNQGERRRDEGFWVKKGRSLRAHRKRKPGRETELSRELPKTGSALEGGGYRSRKDTRGEKGKGERSNRTRGGWKTEETQQMTRGGGF